MFNPNPLKFIMNIENEDGEFRGLGLGGSFCISVAYIIFFNLYGVLNMIPSICSIENLIVLSIYSAIITIIYFILVAGFLAKFYIPKFDINNVAKSGL